ncbi:MAG: tRNA pseudouridine(55) synthase TruB [Gammaproteobacteria bacterium]|nr:tRNA pseudouridine(55) synthase TruB [Gammaproteobacteria bacterium]
MSRRRSDRVQGILLLDKPEGLTSTQALNRAKHALGARRGGHTGSLDPLATGILPLTFGEATKLSAYLLNAGKSYRAEARLGVATETGDADGAVRTEAPVPRLKKAAVDQVLDRFRGEIEQVPPMYSALKHKGERLYEIARRGEVVERRPRPVTIEELRLTALKPDGMTLELRCSKGTYVRTLVEDIAEALGTCGHVVALRRTAVAGFDEGRDPWVTLAELETAEAPRALLMPPDSALRERPALHLGGDLTHFLRHGQPVIVPQAPTEGFIRLYDEEGRFFGVGEMIDDGRIAPRRLLHADT